jgi:hypothetical protein
LAQELIAADLDLDILGPSKKPRKSLKTPIEKLKNYNLILDIIFDNIFEKLLQNLLD